MEKPTKEQIKHHLKELMLVQEEFLEQHTQHEDELINLGWIEALQWVLSGKEDFTHEDQRYYPDNEPKAIIKSNGKREYNFHYSQIPDIDQATKDYNNLNMIEDILKGLDKHENKKLKS